MKFRPASGLGMTLAEAMTYVKEVKTRAELIAFLKAEWLPDEVTEENVTITKYGKGIDHRIGWDTHLVCVNGKAALFTDGPL